MSEPTTPVVADPEDVDEAPRVSIGTVVKAVAGLSLSVGLIVWALPNLTHTSWGRIGQALAQVSPWTILSCFALMFLGLALYTITFSASLPGLSRRRALMLNLIGSAVSNVLPSGGAFGAAAQFAILRSWGFKRRDCEASVIVLTVWNLLVRVLVPVVAVVFLVMLGDTQNMPPVLVTGARIGGIMALAAVALMVFALAYPPAAHVLERALEPFTRRRGGAPAEPEVPLRTQLVTLISKSWGRLTLGLVGFFGVYYLLFTVCLHAAGADLRWRESFACYAVGRFLTLVPITPGGIGATEVGPAALAVVFGAKGARASAAVLLFAIFSNLLEIPFGAIAGLIWSVNRRRRARLATPAPAA